MPAAAATPYESRVRASSSAWSADENEDVLDVIAKLPEIAALIYRCSFKDGKIVKCFDSSASPADGGEIDQAIAAEVAK